MNAAANPMQVRVPVTQDSVRVIHEVGGMGAIFDDAVNVVVLRRSFSAELVADAFRAIGERSFRKTTSVSPDARGRSALDHVLPGLPYLAADVHFWIGVLAELTGCELVGVRLARLELAMCPRFHVDKVLLRVVSAYVGAGTEYLSSHVVDRSRLAAPGASAGDESSGLHGGAGVQSASFGDVLLLKGEAWPNNGGRGAVHRSPAASSLLPRLVMTLDPL
jgi:hypothetical protein